MDKFTIGVIMAFLLTVTSVLWVVSQTNWNDVAHDAGELIGNVQKGIEEGKKDNK